MQRICVSTAVTATTWLLLSTSLLLTEIEGGYYNANRRSASSCFTLGSGTIGHSRRRSTSSSSSRITTATHRRNPFVVENDGPPSSSLSRLPHMRSTSSFSLSSSSSSSSDTAQQVVLLQKVIRSVPLPILIEYVRDIFRVPTDLAVPYEAVPVPPQKTNVLAAFHCPLNADETLLLVEVLGVYVGGDNDDGGANNINNAIATPRMAMVVMKKKQQPPDSPSGTSSSSNSVMGLYEDSERKIVRALERGLDDLSEGRGYYSKQKMAELKRDEEERSLQQEKEEELKQQQQQQEPEEDFAVRQAKKIALELERKQQQQEKNTIPITPEIPTTTTTSLLDDANAFAETLQDSSSFSTGKKNPYRSNDANNVVIDVTADDTANSSPKKSAQSSPPASVAKTPADNSVKATDKEMTEEERQDLLNSVFNNPLDPSSSSSYKEGKNDADDPYQDMMNNSNSSDADTNIEITPEELLQTVLDFGEKSSQEEQVGHGFATGAFEKAKELLRSTASNNKQPPPQRSVDFKEPGANMNDFLRPPADEEEIIDEREELRRIFAAGKEAAEGRIVDLDTTTVTTDYGDTDALIDADRTVPRSSSSSNNDDMEDELAELELRIARTPGDDQGPVFDLFAGPTTEASSDPVTDVNWPGAQPGTKEKLDALPADLREAVTNARFAAEVLSKVTQSEDGTTFYVGEQETSEKQVRMLQKCVEEAVQAGLIDVHPLEEMAERSRLDLLLDELTRNDDRFDDIVESYRDLLLSDRFVGLVQERLQAMAVREQARRDAPAVTETKEEDDHDAMERTQLSKLTNVAMLLLKEVRAVGAELEASQVEIVRSICQVAMNPKYVTEEEAAHALTDTVRGMRPLLDDTFVAYLKYAVAEEEGRLARRGLLEDPDHNSWLVVLKIVQQGVYSELSTGVSRYVDHIEYVLRMDTKKERKELLRALVDVMPSMDVRPFVKVVDNIVASLGTSASGDFDGASVLGGMTKEIMQLSNDLKDILPPERIQIMSKDADEWAAKQRKKIEEQRKHTKMQLRAKQAQAALIEGASKSTPQLRG